MDAGFALPGRVLHDYAANYGREWLVANGIGGYASSTVIGANTRRYHGLLVAAVDPPGDRRLFLAKVEEELLGEGSATPLAVNRYPGVLHPRGHELLAAFRLRPRPTFVYAVGERTVTKEVGVVAGRNAVVLRYALEGPMARLRLRPLVTGRDFHGETREGSPWTFRQEASPQGFAVEPFPGSPRLHVAVDGGLYRPEGLWYRNFVYDLEAERGLPEREDLFSPGVFEADLGPGRPLLLAAALEEPAPGALWAEAAAGGEPRSGRGGIDPFLEALGEAADAFLVRRSPTAASVIAGYHWFGEWGRDAMVSLPGLCLVRGRFTAAKGILRTFAAHLREGLIPNRFADAGGEAEYNSVDASLWFVRAVEGYLRASGDDAFLTEVLPGLREIIEAYRRGTRYGIGMDDDGLLRAGSPGVQLTWMDAKIDDEVVTPRHGRAVEVNALWCHALEVVGDLCARAGGGNPYAPLAARAREAFRTAFWSPDLGYLFDVLGPGGPDASLRPNQLLALALPRPLLGRRQGERVLAAVEGALLTPYGLRTLAPGDPRYRGRFGGDRRQRDEAYHNGSVWPWLLGPYADALAFVRGRRAAAALARRVRAALEPHLWEAGLGTISELFDGDPPHRPGGCISQAWSVAEVLRILVEYGGGHGLPGEAKGARVPPGGARRATG